MGLVEKGWVMEEGVWLVEGVIGEEGGRGEVEEEGVGGGGKEGMVIRGLGGILGEGYMGSGVRDVRFEDVRGKDGVVWVGGRGG